MSMSKRLIPTVAAAGALALGGGLALAQGYGGPYGFGATPSTQDIAAVDIDVMPDGRGLPPGSGTYAQGKEVFTAQCSACHGGDLAGIPRPAATS